MKEKMKSLVLTLALGLFGLSAEAGDVAEVINAAGESVGTYASANAAFGAINSVSDGSTLRLLADCTVTECGDFGKSFTIDLKGFTLTADYASKGSDNYFTSPGSSTKGKTLTIKNGKFVCGSRCMGIANLKDGTLIMEGVTSTSSAASPDINQEAGSSTVRNCVFDGDSRRVMGVYVGGGVGTIENCEVTVKSGSAWSSAALGVAGNAKLTVKGGTYTSPAYSLYVLQSGGTIIVEGGIYHGDVYMDGRGEASSALLQINDGDFSGVANWSRYSKNYNTFELTGCTLGEMLPPEAQYYTSDFECVATGDGKYRVQIKNYDTYVARIGKGYHTSFSGAINAANDNDTVTLLQNYSWDITPLYLTKSLTIDLHGFELTLKETSTSRYYFTVNGENKTLTIKNGSIVAKGAVLASSSAARSMVRLEDVQATQDGGCFVTATAENSGLEIIGCTIVAGTKQSAMLVNVNWGASCVISGSTLDNSKCTATTNQNGCPFAVFNQSSVTLNGSCRLMSANASKLIHNKDSTVTVEAGTYNFNPNATVFTLASGCTVSGPVNGIYTVAGDTPPPPVSTMVTITLPATPPAGIASYSLYDETAQVALDVLGNMAEVEQGHEVSITIVPATGYEATMAKKSLGTVSADMALTSGDFPAVTAKTQGGAVQVGDQTYATLSDAVPHLTAGCTITLLQDLEMTSTFAPTVSCTLDLNGKTLSGAASLLDKMILIGTAGTSFTLCNGFVDMSKSSTDTSVYFMSVDNGATALVDGVTGTSLQSSYYGVFQSDRAGTCLTIRNSTLNVRASATKSLVRVNYTATAIIENSTLDMSAATYYSGYDEPIYVNNSTAVIRGNCVLKGAKGSSARSFYVSKKSISVSGGEFDTPFFVTSGTSANITGGTFAADPSAYVDQTKCDVAQVSGKWVVSLKDKTLTVALPDSLPTGVASFKVNNVTQGTSTAGTVGGTVTVQQGDVLELEVIPSSGYEAVSGVTKTIGAVTESMTLDSTYFPTVRQGGVVEAIRISVEGEDDVTVGSFGEVTAYLNDLFEVEAATLTLLQDIGGDASVAFEDPFSVSCNLTLDLNGYTLCWDGLDAAFEVTPYVQFVVTDGAGGGVLTSSFDDVIGSYGQLTIAGGTIQGAVYAYEGEGSSLAITGGTFDVAVGTDFEGFISGGRFKVKPAAECFASGKAASAEVDADGYYTVVDKPTSYKIEIRDENGNLIDGSDSWGLKDACDAVKTARVDGRTIRVTQDLGDIANISGYDFGCSVTIDLSGHAFRNTSSTDAYMFTPGTAGKTLAIVNGHVTFFNDTCNGLALVSAGTFVASNVTCTAGAQTSGKASVQVNGSGAAKIVDCTFDGANRWGSALFVSSKDATGEIGGTTSVCCPNALPDSVSGNWYAHAPVRVSNDGHVTINGGTYVGAKFALYVMSSGGHMTVNGGTFSGPVKCDLNTSTAGNPKSADITISDGDFTACSFVSRAGNHFNISGGTFRDNPETYDNVTIASGKEATKQGDVWVVGDKQTPTKKGTIILFGL